MDELFWATGIDNSGLQRDKEKAVKIFEKLAADVNEQVNAMDTSLNKLKEAGNFKFTNPVDPQMFASIKQQVNELTQVIDAEIKKLGDFSYHYDTAMNNIRNSASKINTLPAADPLGPTVTKIKSRVSEADKSINFLKRIFQRGVAYLAVYGSINWAENFAKQVVVTKGQFDQLGVAINAFVGNAERSKSLINDITNFAIKSPFQLLDITNSAKQLLAYGVQAKDVMSTLKLLSDVAAASGQRIEDITYLYGTSMTRGRVYAREMYQFASRGIPIWQALSKEMGVNREELTKMVRNGQVGFKDLKAALQSLAGPGGIDFGLSDKIASTTYGRLSNLEDAWKKALKEIGEANTGIVNEGIDATSQLIQHWQRVADTIKSVIVAVGAYKAAQIAAGAVTRTKTTAYAAGYVGSVEKQGGITSGFAEAASQAGQKWLARSTDIMYDTRADITLESHLIPFMSRPEMSVDVTITTA